MTTARALLLLALCSLPLAVAAEVMVFAPPPCTGDLRHDHAALLACFAPLWLAPGAEHAYNRIGTPIAALEHSRFGGDDVEIRIDPDQPTQFAAARAERVGGRDLLQLVYRVHFERIPWSWSWHFFEAHRHAGLLALVTLDAATLEPLFVTTVHTCGCYRAVIPTTSLADAALPPAWPKDRQCVFGQSLPARLASPLPGSTRLLITLAPDSHRVIDVEVRGDRPAGIVRPTALADLDALRRLRAADGSEHSFYYARGPLKGHVKGAWNALEGLTLFGLVALDPTVGMDKEFGAPEHTGTPFYTSLPFWRHEASRLDRFEALLGELGFRFDALGGAAE